MQRDKGFKSEYTGTFLFNSYTHIFSEFLYLYVEGEFCTRKIELRTNKNKFCTSESDLRTNKIIFCTRDIKHRTLNIGFCTCNIVFQTREIDLRTSTGEFCTSENAHHTFKKGLPTEDKELPESGYTFTV